MQETIIYVQLIFWVFLSACSNSVSRSLSPDGTYQLTTQAGKRYEIQLITAVDSFVYGTIHLQSDTAHFDAPVVLKNHSANNLSVEFWYGERFLTLSRSKTDWQGLAKIEEDTVEVQMEKLSRQVDNDLLASAQLVPLPLRAEAPAYVSPKRDGRMYVIGWADGQISLAKETATAWEEKMVTYDHQAFRFSSIGLSPDEQMLVAHGRPKGEASEAEQGGALYFLHLADEYTIDSIEVLPMTVNTSSYDNFPDFTNEGDIIFSSWGAAAGKPGQGKGDLYRAVRTGAGWQTSPLSAVLNTEIADAGPSLNKEEDVIFFHRLGEKPPLTSDKIFASKKWDGRWQSAVPLPAPINLDHSGQYGPRLDRREEYFYWTSHHRGRGHLYRLPVQDIPELRALLINE